MSDALLISKRQVTLKCLRDLLVAHEGSMATASMTNGVMNTRVFSPHMPLLWPALHLSQTELRHVVEGGWLCAKMTIFSGQLFVRLSRAMVNIRCS